MKNTSKINTLFMIFIFWEIDVLEFFSHDIKLTIFYLGEYDTTEATNNCLIILNSTTLVHCLHKCLPLVQFGYLKRIIINKRRFKVPIELLAVQWQKIQILEA